MKSIRIFRKKLTMSLHYSHMLLQYGCFDKSSNYKMHVSISDSYDVLEVKFYLSRIRSHYIVLTYIPSLLLVLLSCLLFWLPLPAVLERFIFGALLVLGLNQVLSHSQDQAPQVSGNIFFVLSLFLAKKIGGLKWST